MVYCGKPSKGCSSCRERKIRCDQQEPSCGQCEKRQQKCPGYRNIVDLMFRDESSQVIKKATARTRKRATSSSDKSTSPTARRDSVPVELTWSPDAATPGPSFRKPSRQVSWSSSSASATSSPPHAFLTTFQVSPKRLAEDDNQDVKQEPAASPGFEPPAPRAFQMVPSYEDRALNLFIARYVSVSASSCHHKFDFVFDFWKPSTSASERAQDPVFASVTSVGLLGVAQMTQSPAPLELARQSYGHALRLTNAALRDPDEALKDTTMLSVLVLGLFETSMDRSPRGVRAWQQHINGAAALARMRGAGQLRTKAGIRMFMMQCQNTMINCIQHELPMPQDLIDLRRQLISMLGGSGKVPRYEICVPIYKILQLKYDIKQGIVTDIEEMLAKFNEAEGDFERAISLFPEEWHYRKFHLTRRQQPGFFNDACHVYPAIAAATVWNGLRTCRLLILETMLEELHKRFLHVPVHMVPVRYQIECQKAKFKMRRIALAVLASVPQHFGLVSEDSLDALAPVPSAEDLWPQMSEQECEAPLGESEGSDSDSDDEDYYWRSPSLSNPMTARGPEAQAERFMLLSSATNGLVWPLYLVGMSTVSTAAMRAFVVDRLHAIHSDTGLGQAGRLADFVSGHRHSSEGRRAKTSELVLQRLDQAFRPTPGDAAGMSGGVDKRRRRKAT